MTPKRLVSSIYGNEAQNAMNYPRPSMYGIAYLDPCNHPDVGKYASPMDGLGITKDILVWNFGTTKRWKNWKSEKAPQKNITNQSNTGIFR